MPTIAPVAALNVPLKVKPPAIKSSTYFLVVRVDMSSVPAVCADLTFSANVAN